MLSRPACYNSRPGARSVGERGIERQGALRPKRFRRFEERIAALEEEVARLRLGNAVVTPKQVDAALRVLGKKVQGGKPQPSYFNTRFRSFEAALANIRALGIDLSQRRYRESQQGRMVGLPTRQAMKSKTCTQADVESDWAIFWANEIKQKPLYGRKLWEFEYVAQALWAAGKLASGARGLGFGCGKEPLPSLFAKYGAEILATDLPDGRPGAEAWSAGNQHASQVADLLRHDLCPDPLLLKNIAFRPVDMNDIDRDLDGSFDFCWSICALEHLGSIQKGFDFIENSLRTLRPGGVAVHTTEFTFDAGPARDNVGTVLFTKEMMIEFADKLRSKGFEVADFDFSPGDGLLNSYADIATKAPHDSREHKLRLKLEIDGFVCTSIGLIVTVPGGQSPPIA